MSIGKLITQSSLVVTIFTSLISSHVYAESSGVLGLYEVNKNTTPALTLKKIEQHAQLQGCSVRREGTVENIQGNYSLKEANRFFLLECEKNHQGNMINQYLFSTLKTLESLVLVAGNMSQMGNFGLSEPAGKRSYIIKLSDYNNKNPATRESDLQNLGKKNQTLKHHYMQEAFIRVNDAAGIKRPDEVVVIYYHTSKDAKIFRSSNASFMKKIGQFNDDHLSQYSYLSVTSHR